MKMILGRSEIHCFRHTQPSLLRKFLARVDVGVYLRCRWLSQHHNQRSGEEEYGADHGLPGQSLAKEYDGEYDRQHEAAFIDRDNLGDVTGLDGVEIAQPRGSGGETGQDQEYPAAGAYDDIPPALFVRNTIPQASASTTIVRMAVARLESTPSIPILARIAVAAANTADRIANNNHIFF